MCFNSNENTCKSQLHFVGILEILIIFNTKTCLGNAATGRVGELRRFFLICTSEKLKNKNIILKCVAARCCKFLSLGKVAENGGNKLFPSGNNNNNNKKSNQSSSQSLCRQLVPWLQLQREEQSSPAEKPETSRRS